VYSPPEPFNQLKSKIFEQAVPLSRLLFFLSSNIQLSETIQKILPNYNVISDRYVFSTIVYHLAIENVPYSDISELVTGVLPNIRMPNKVILFTVDREEQLRRQQKKQDDLFQTQLIQNDDFQIRVTESYRTVLDDLNMDWIEINTTCNTPEETKEIVLDIL
jgi:thymidylate kinase